MKKLLALAAAALLLNAGSFVAPLQAQSVSVAAACSAQSLPVGYNNGTLIQTQNGDLCTNATGGGGGGNTTVKSTAAAPSYSEGVTTNPVSSDLHGSLRMLPLTPAGVAVDLSTPATLMGSDGVTIMTSSNPLESHLNASTAVIGKVGIDQTTPGTSNNVTVSSSALPTGAATQTTLALIPVAQASATAGQSGPLVQGAVTTANPAYTTGQTSPVSVDVTGGLRITGNGPVANGTAQTGSLLQGCVFNTTLPTLTTGQQSAVQCTNRGLPITAVGDANGQVATSNNPVDTTSSVRALFAQTQNLLLTSGLSNWARSRDVLGSFGSGTGVAAVEQAGATISYINTATTTQVKTGAGILHKIIINTPVAGTISVLDNTTGSTVNFALITMTADVKPFEITYDAGFTSGLRIITSVAADITVVYR